MNELYKSIKASHGEKLPIPSDSKLSKTMKRLLRDFLQMDPNKRISWNNFFNHEIFGLQDFHKKKKSLQIQMKSERCVYTSKITRSQNISKSKSKTKQKDPRSVKKDDTITSKKTSPFKFKSSKDIFKMMEQKKYQNKLNMQNKFYSQKNTPKIKREKFQSNQKKADTINLFSEQTQKSNNFEVPIQTRTINTIRSREMSPFDIYFQNDSRRLSANKFQEKYIHKSRELVSNNRQRNASKDEMKKINLRKKKEIPRLLPKSTEKERIDNSFIPMHEVMARMSTKHCLQENFYFFCHEINKIHFIMEVAQSTFSYLKSTHIKFLIKKFLNNQLYTYFYSFC